MPKIDASKCIGCGLCVDLCPAVFRMNGQSRAEVIKGQSGRSEAGVKNAAAACPAGAINLK
jgi:ferredoxin